MTTTSTATCPPRPRRRLLRVIVRGALVIVGVVGLFIAYLAYDEWRARREWVAECAEADRLDPGWRWEDLVGKIPTVRDERDSAVRLLAAQRLLPQGWPMSAAIRTRNHRTPPT